ncbi:MAG: GNAT family N-acetyltransferase [Saprospiraceae bacterium]
MITLNLKTKRLHLRALQMSDLADFHQYRSNPVVTQYQGFDVMTLEAARQFITTNSTRTFGKAGEWVQYAIADLQTEQLLGDYAIQLDAQDVRIAQVGMTISHLHQRKGYAKEALLRILAFLFEEQSVLRVVEIMDAENTAAIRSLESVGFRQEGHFIENIFFKGKWGSEYQYAMLKREWEENKAKIN